MRAVVAFLDVAHVLAVVLAMGVEAVEFAAGGGELESAPGLAVALALAFLDVLLLDVLSGAGDVDAVAVEAVAGLEAGHRLDGRELDGHRHRLDGAEHVEQGEVPTASTAASRKSTSTPRATASRASPERRERRAGRPPPSRGPHRLDAFGLAGESGEHGGHRRPGGLATCGCPLRTRGQDHAPQASRDRRRATASAKVVSELTTE